MDKVARMLNSCLDSSYRLMEAGLAAMARYPYDLNDGPWDEGFWESAPTTKQDDDHPGGGGGGNGGGRSIKLMPAPASRRYHSATPRRISQVGS